MIQAESAQEESKEVSEVVQVARIQELEKQLKQVSAEADNNKAAAEILSQMLDKGEIMQNPDGSVEVIREDAGSQASNVGGDMM